MIGVGERGRLEAHAPIMAQPSPSRGGGPGIPSADWPSRRLQPGGMPLDEVRRAAPLGPPARALLATARRVEPQAGDDHVGMAAVGVGGDPPALAALAVGHEPGRVARDVEQAGLVEDVGDGAGAVVARVPPAAVAAAPLVGLAGDLVGRGDRAHDLLRGAGRRDGRPAAGRERGLGDGRLGHGRLAREPAGRRLGGREGGEQQQREQRRDDGLHGVRTSVSLSSPLPR